jgi:hypothetical protein
MNLPIAPSSAIERSAVSASAHGGRPAGKTEQHPNSETPTGQPQKAAARRTCILVLGMHRSGTSALTRVISLLGAELPKEMLGANPSNPTGHWEPQRLIDLHERMLAEAGSSWDDWRAFEPTDLARSRLHFYRAEIAQILDEEYGKAPLFVLKEPRLSRFVPLYIEILKSMGVALRIVHICRNPLAVIASLARRDGFTDPFAALLWLRHEVEAERATRGSKRVFVTYEGLIADWTETFRMVDAALGIDWPRPPAEAAAEIGTYLSREHQHHASSEARLRADGRISHWVKDAYAALSALAANADDAEAALVLERIGAEFNASTKMLGDAFYSELAQRQSTLANKERHWRETAGRQADELARVVDHTRREIANAAALVEEGTREREHLARRLAERDARLGELAGEVERYADRLAQAVELADRHRRERSELWRQIANRDDSIAAHVRDIEDLRAAGAAREAEIARERDEFARQIEELGRRLGGGEQALRALQADRAELQRMVEERGSELEAESRRIADLTAERDDLVSRSQAELERLSSALEVAEEGAREARDASAATELALRREIADREVLRSELQQHLTDLSGQLQASNDALALARQEIDNAKAADAVTRQLLARSQRQADALRASTSWQITKPLRLAKQAWMQPDSFLDFFAKKLKSKSKIPPAQFGAQSPAKSTRPIHAAEIRSLKELDAIRRSDYFDANWYSQQYSSYLTPDTDPAVHYLELGYKLGLNPGPRFDSRAYIDFYRDIKAAGVNPLYHYISFGAKEGRQAKPPTRRNALNLFRFSPHEGGEPDSVLTLDAYERTAPVGALGRIVVHLHLYHTELAGEAVEYLQNISDQFTLLVSIQLHEPADSWEAFFAASIPSAKKVIIKNVDNIGRDVYPWVVEFKDYILNSDIFCHIHTKRSSHNNSHAGWRRFLYHSILGSLAVTDQILDIFHNDPIVGIVSPCYFWSLASQPNYGRNKTVCGDLLRRIADKPVPDQCPNYPAGSFFWARTEVLKPLLEAGIVKSDFGPETAQVDGTMAHGVERVLGMLPGLSGRRFHMVTVDVPYDLRRYVNTNRRAYSRAIKHSRQAPGVLTNRKSERKVQFYSCLSGNYEPSMPLVSNLQGA